MSPSTYREGAFAAAADRIGLELVRAIDLPDALAERYHGPLRLYST
jgi:hypothetical protein